MSTWESEMTPEDWQSVMNQKKLKYSAEAKASNMYPSNPSSEYSVRRIHLRHILPCLCQSCKQAGR